MADGSQYSRYGGQQQLPPFLQQTQLDRITV